MTPLSKPTDYDQLYPGRFIKAGLLLGKPVTLTIAAVDREKLPQDDGSERVRGVVSFRESDQQWVLNSTNGQCLRAMFGRDPQSWVGKRVTLVPERDRFGPEMVDAIRVLGSPDIESDVDAVIKMPRKKDRRRSLKNTSKGKD